MKKKKNRKEIPPPEFVMLEADTYVEIEPRDLFEHIEYNYKAAIIYLRRAGKHNADLREVLVRWGVWSRRMNVLLRARIHKSIPMDYLIHKEDEGENNLQASKVAAFQHNIMQLKLVYGYWWNRTHQLEQYRKSFFGRISDRKNIDQGAISIRNMLINDVGIEEIKTNAPNFYNLIERLATKKELSKEETEQVLDTGIGRVNSFD